MSFVVTIVHRLPESCSVIIDNPACTLKQRVILGLRGGSAFWVILSFHIAMPSKQISTLVGLKEFMAVIFVPSLL